MRPNLRIAALCLSALASPLPALPQASDLGLPLNRIQANIAVFNATLPDFVADEKVVSRRVVGEKTQAMVVVESVFTCARRGAGKDALLDETREVLSVNGKPAKKGQALDGPSIFRGAIASVLTGTFGPENAPFQTYRYAGQEVIQGKPALAIEFATKEGQTRLAISFDGRRVVTTDSGRAFFDAESMQVVRLERRFTGLPKKGELMLTIDYAEIVIDGKSFRMPKTVTSVLHRVGSKPPWNGIYSAEYANYRKFSVETGITFQ